MGTRGRTSRQEIEVSKNVLSREVERPKAPAELTDEQKAEWRAVVERLPADWFKRETHGLLAAYCRHVVASKRVQQLIEAEEARIGELTRALDAGRQFGLFDLEKVAEVLKALDGYRQYDRLLKMQERESRAIASMATKMRISQQTSNDKSKKRDNSPGKKPWEIE